MIEIDIKVDGWVDAIQFYQNLNEKTKIQVELAMERYGRYVLSKIREIIEREEKHSDFTHRLLESFERDSDELIFNIKREGDLFLLEIGTLVPYGIYIEHGFHFTGPKVVMIHNIGFRTVDSYDYDGMHMIERGMTEHQYFLNFQMGKALKAAGYKANFTHIDTSSFYGFENEME